MTDRVERTRVEWTIDVRATALFVIASVLVVGLFAFLHRGSGEMKWSLVPGTIQDTRIIPDHGLETKWGGELTWKAEYRVDYSVAGRNYAVWADSGIRGERNSYSFGFAAIAPPVSGEVEPPEARSVDRRLPMTLSSAGQPQLPYFRGTRFEMLQRIS